MSKPPQQFIQNQRKKRMKLLQSCNGKQPNLRKNPHLAKNLLALKKEIMCLKRSNSNLKLQLNQQKLEYTALDRKYINLEAEIDQLQLANSALKEENRHYEKLFANTEPEIRSCMTRLVETSQTLASLQMAYNKNRSRQQLSKISGSLSKTLSRFHTTTSKSTSKSNKNVLNVVPRRKQAVRPMVQGLQIFTNLTIPLQRVSLPNQNSRSRIQVPVVEVPQESEAVNIAVEPERTGPTLFEKQRRNLHFKKNMKSKPKHFEDVNGSITSQEELNPISQQHFVTEITQKVQKCGVKKDDLRHSKNDIKHSGLVRMVPEINFDDLSESELEIKKYLKPIVLIRDFNVASSKGGKCSSLDRNFTIKTSSSKTAVSDQFEANLQDPLEGTSKMYLSPSCHSNKSDTQEKPTKVSFKDQNCSCVTVIDSESDHSSQDPILPTSHETQTSSSMGKTDMKVPDIVPSASSISVNEQQPAPCQSDLTNSSRIAENTLEMNLTQSLVIEERCRFESINVDSGS